MHFWIIATVFSIILIVSKYFSRRNTGNFPRGPLLKLPLLGHLPLLGPFPYKTFAQWSKSYGKIFSVQLGAHKAVVLNDYKLIKECANDLRFCDRPVLPFSRNAGIINGRGYSWQEGRRLALVHLKSFFATRQNRGNSDIDSSFPNSSSIIQSEIRELLELVLPPEKCRFGQIPVSLDLDEHLSIFVLSTIWRFVGVDKIPQSHPQLLTVVQDLKRFCKTGWGNNKNLDTFLPAPWKTLIKSWTGTKKDERGPGIEPGTQVDAFVREQIALRKSTLPPLHEVDHEPRDFTDSFLIAQHQNQKCPDLKSGFYGKDAENELTAIVRDFLVGGVEATSTTLLWVIFYLGTHPDIQRELHQEIDEVIGTSGALPTMDARPRMPLTIAILMETLRKSSLFPLGLPHATIQDVRFHGFDLPKGTLVCLNLWAAHHQEVDTDDADDGRTVWGDDVHGFNPFRFITESQVKGHGLEKSDGIIRKLVRNEASIPFSTGKRGCIGELLSKEILFLTTATIFQRFSISIDLGHQVDLNSPKNQTKLFSMVRPPPFKVLVRERHNF